MNLTRKLICVELNKMKDIDVRGIGCVEATMYLNALPLFPSPCWSGSAKRPYRQHNKKTKRMILTLQTFVRAPSCSAPPN